MALLLATAMLFAGGVAAQAVPGKCDLGYSCLWMERTYEGTSYGTERSKTKVADWLYKLGNSAGANGRACDHTRYYESWSYTTGNPSGKYFTLYSEHRIGSNYRDPNLSNGAGFDGTGINWANRVGAVAHMKCS